MDLTPDQKAENARRRLHEWKCGNRSPDFAPEVCAFEMLDAIYCLLRTALNAQPQPTAPETAGPPVKAARWVGDDIPVSRPDLEG